MRWKQFFTPVTSMNAQEAKAFMAKGSPDDYTILDVRQPNEYEHAHIPGSKLIPMPDLAGRLAEIDPEKPVLVY